MDKETKVEILDSKTWEEFIDSPIAVLMLGKNGCVACESWTEELLEWQIPEGVRVGEIILDNPGFGRFKIAHPWVSDVDVLPFNAIFVNGQQKKAWAGGGISRLENRLNRIMQ